MISWYDTMVPSLTMKVEPTMPVTQESPGPYAPAATLLGIVERYRNKGLPTPVDPDVLARASVSDSLIPRTLHSLRALDLIDEQGVPTEVLESIRLAPEASYKAALAKWLEATYADVLQFVDPATADESKLRDAFRNYQPQGQQSRMITLFSGLFRAAGIGPEKTGAAPRKRTMGLTTAPRLPRKSPEPRKGDGNGRRVGGGGGGIAAPGLPPAIAGVLVSLPDPSMGWIKADRDKFLVAFTAVLDFAIPTVAAVRREPDIEGGDDAAL